MGGVAVAGEGQEYVVEGRAVGRDLGRGCPGVVEPAEHHEDLVGGAARGDVDRSQYLVGACRIQAPERTLIAGGVGELEPHDLRTEAGLQLLWRTAGDDATVVEHRDGVGELVCLLEVLRGQQDGDALCDEAADGAPQLLAAARVKPGRGLVEEQQLVVA